MSVIKKLGTPENAGILLAVAPVGLAAPDAVKQAFVLTRMALGFAVGQITPERFALVSLASLIYYYYGDKMVMPAGKAAPISLDLAKRNMAAALERSKSIEAGLPALREIAEKVRENTDAAKRDTVHWVQTLEEAEEAARIGEAVKRSNLGVEPKEVAAAESAASKAAKTAMIQGKPVGNYSIPGPVAPAAPKAAAPVAEPPFQATSQPLRSSRFVPGEPAKRGGRRTKRNRRHRPSAPTRKARSSSSKHRRYTRQRRV